MVIAANLKTNLTRIQTNEYLKELEEFLDASDTAQNVIVFPATSSLNRHAGKVSVGVQNAYPAKNGAFTGEIGLDHIEEFGIKTILIGHSERRHIFGETQKQIVEKFNYFKDLGFEIVYCIGEPLDIRESGEDNMMKYLDAQYEGIDVDYENLIIAYEPVWAIGTGLTPTMEDIKTIHKNLKTKSLAPLLYGGSVKVNNAKEILAIDNVDGVLVGSAALNVKDFSSMISFAEKL